ncbi:hypothetical protein SK128_011478 [Halocaridina rubra]|uniref:Uncharacterized protein n=1 Tax=Halocaridina rubra TaxID=373956 RepID=A0AAN8XIB7_HALRR
MPTATLNILGYSSHIFYYLFTSDKDLGVNILEDLSPEMHINGIVRAAYAFLASVRVAVRHIDKDMFRNIYVTYCKSS